MHTADWWWEMQVQFRDDGDSQISSYQTLTNHQMTLPIGSNVIPIFITCDQKCLTNFSGNKKLWPLCIVTGAILTIQQPDILLLQRNLFGTPNNPSACKVPSRLIRTFRLQSARENVIVQFMRNHSSTSGRSKPQIKSELRNVNLELWSLHLESID